MAEKDLLIDPHGDAAPDSPLGLKKRARRRLVGAIALALLAVIVLPMVMDQAPRPLTQDIQIRIPSQDPGASNFVSRIAPKLAPNLAPAASTPLPQEAGKTATPAAAAPRTAPSTAPGTALTKPETKPETKQESKTVPAKVVAPAPAAPAPDKTTPSKPAETAAAVKNADTARAAALLNDEHWIVQLGAYRNAENAKSITGKIKSLGLPTFTEKIDTPQGLSTRVRSGPFASREAAEKAQERLKKIGIGAPLGGVVAQAQ